MTTAAVSGSGTREDPWNLKTPPGTSEYQMYRDETRDPPALVCQVGSTQLTAREILDRAAKKIELELA